MNIKDFFIELFEDLLVEEKESEPPRKKIKARKTQENILQDDEGTQILHR